MKMSPCSLVGCSVVGTSCLGSLRLSAETQGPHRSQACADELDDMRVPAAVHERHLVGAELVSLPFRLVPQHPSL